MRSTKHDVHGKTPPFGEGGGEAGKARKFGSHSSHRHHHSSKKSFSPKKSENLQKNHSMPLVTVKMERLPSPMSAKNNAPTLHLSPNHKSPNSVEWENIIKPKEEKDPQMTHSLSLASPSHHSMNAQDHSSNSIKESEEAALFLTKETKSHLKPLQDKSVSKAELFGDDSSDDETKPNDEDDVICVSSSGFCNTSTSSIVTSGVSPSKSGISNIPSLKHNSNCSSNSQLHCTPVEEAIELFSQGDYSSVSTPKETVQNSTSISSMSQCSKASSSVNSNHGVITSTSFSSKNGGNGNAGDIEKVVELKPDKTFLDSKCHDEKPESTLNYSSITSQGHSTHSKHNVPTGSSNASTVSTGLKSSKHPSHGK